MGPGNGPGLNYFDYPYAAVPIGDQLLVLSSFRGAIYSYDIATLKLNSVLVRPTNAWTAADSAPDTRLGLGWKAYVNLGGQPFNFAGHSLLPGYGHLHDSNDLSPVFRTPDVGTLFNRSMLHYFIQVTRLDGAPLLVSSANGVALLLVTSSSGDVVVPLTLGAGAKDTNGMVDAWVVGEAMLADGYPVNTEPLRRQRDEFFRRLSTLEEIRSRRAVTEAEVLTVYATPEGGVPVSDNGPVSAVTDERLAKSFASAPGKVFWANGASV